MTATVSVTATIRSNGKDKETAHKAKMQEVAKLIVGNGTPPSYLRDVLSDLSFEVKSADSIETLLPTKAELWDQLDSIQRLAWKLSELLQSPMTPGFLAAAGSREDEGYIRDEVVPHLFKLAALARKAKNSPRLVTVDGNVQPGRGRPHLPGSMPPKYVSAAIVAEVWSYFHQDESPAPTNRQALAAAAQLYGAWFPTKGWGNDALKGWEYYLESVGHPDLLALRKEVRRLLANRAHFEAMMTENKTQ